ncbi:phosphopantetheine-binding protein [Actinoplanes siamensis]|uniref:Carrier domain-containing protein n=1 Tax=Actinoplanes siamensis TaxID=1223317 RepID=A0A919TJN9_9ACTN|nr:phosphopantetheine-binding protein [Actinoplanes siamensis]GIF04584.1 hypothetical protein Asi03nite_21220 [Actinoplanes siamensis]
MTDERTVMIAERVHAIWCRELQNDDVAYDDDFFALAGHSLIMAKIQRAFVLEIGVEVPVDQLYRNPTVASISAYIESLQTVAT